jgi:hypothetical protein
MFELIVGLALLPAALVVGFWIIVILLGIVSAPFLLVLGLLSGIIVTLKDTITCFKFRKTKV